MSVFSLLFSMLKYLTFKTNDNNNANNNYYYKNCFLYPPSWRPQPLLSETGLSPQSIPSHIRSRRISPSRGGKCTAAPRPGLQQEGWKRQAPSCPALPSTQRAQTYQRESSHDLLPHQCELRHISSFSPLLLTPQNAHGPHCPGAGAIPGSGASLGVPFSLALGLSDLHVLSKMGSSFLSQLVGGHIEPSQVSTFPIRAEYE